MTPTHYVLCRGRHSMVKEAEFFVSQGGLIEPWGKHWVGVEAAGIEEARVLAAAMPYSDPMPTPVECPPLSIQVIVAGTLVFEWTDPESCGPDEVARALRHTAKMLADMPIMFATIGIEGKPEHATKVCGVPR